MIPEEREPLDRLFDLLVEAVARELVESAFTDRFDRYELSAKKSPELLRPGLINFRMETSNGNTNSPADATSATDGHFLSSIAGASTAA
jgi:hypothetical protein